MEARKPFRASILSDDLWDQQSARRSTRSSRDPEAGRQARLPQVDAVAADWNTFLEQEVSLPLPHREAAVGMDHAVPWKAFVSGGKNVTDHARRFRVDVAVRADKSNGNRADPSQDQFCARIDAGALHASGQPSGP